MKKVFTLGANEDWICDRLKKEWDEDNADISVTSPRNADVIWLLSDWMWAHVPTGLLAAKKVLTTIHHIVPDKFGQKELQDFKLRDTFTNVYHVPNEHTKNFIQQYTSKPIHIISYWGNQKIWKKTGDPESLRKAYGLPPGQVQAGATYLIGSFQRDTEGSDLVTPKLEKGPDLLADAIITYRDRCAHLFPLEVVLAGWRRQYLMKRLEDANVNYYYFEKPSQETINDLYQTLNLYPVTARYEGGPQSLIEAGLLGVPVVSRNIGIASQVLPASAINDDVTLATPCIPNVDNIKLPTGYKSFRNLIENI